MIRFSATLVIVAIGVLIGGVATSKLTLIYVAIAISAIALVTLAVGVVLKREELFGQVGAPAGMGGSAEPSASGQAAGADVGADPTELDPVIRNGPVAPPVSPFPGPPSMAVPSVRGADDGLAAADLGADGGGTGSGQDRFSPPSSGRSFTGQPAAGQPASGQPAPGQPAFGQNPAKSPWPTSATTSGWSSAEPDLRSDRDRGGRPPQPGRHSKHSGDPWSPFPADKPASGPDALTPSFSPAPGSHEWPPRYPWLNDHDNGKTEVRDIPAPEGSTSEPGTPPSASTTAEPSGTPAASPAAAPGNAATPGITSSSVADPAEGAAEAESAAVTAPGERSADEPVATDAHGASSPQADGDAESAPPAAGPVDGVRLVTVVPGVPRYHEPNCILIRFMPEDDVQNMTLSEAKKLGTPCVACQPEG